MHSNSRVDSISYLGLLCAVCVVFLWSFLTAGVDKLPSPLSELDMWRGRLTAVNPEDASWASARNLDTNLPGRVLREASSRLGMAAPPGSGSRRLDADGGRMGDIGGVFHAARTSSGGFEEKNVGVKKTKKKKEHSGCLAEHEEKVCK